MQLQELFIHISNLGELQAQKLSVTGLEDETMKKKKKLGRRYFYGLPTVFQPTQTLQLSKMSLSVHRRGLFWLQKKNCSTTRICFVSRHASFRISERHRLKFEKPLQAPTGKKIICTMQHDGEILSALVKTSFAEMTLYF